MIKAWTKVRVDSWDRYFRIRRILYKWKNPDLQVPWICPWRFKLESNHVPKFLATVTGATSMLPTVTLPIFILESCCFVPINMNSVLSSLGLSLSVSIHVLCRNVRYTAFHGNDRISVISSRVLHINKIETRRAFFFRVRGYLRT